jgi:hypothetical protein
MRVWTGMVMVLVATGCGGPSQPASTQAASPPAADMAVVPDQDSVGGTTQPRDVVAATAPHKALPAGVVLLRRVSIPDPGVIAQGTALTALVPDGWQARGGVIAARGLCAEPFAVDWSVISPDGRSSLAIFPTEIWQWSNTSMHSDCEPGAFTNVREYLEARVRRALPGARILDFRERPDFARSASESARMLQQMFQQAGVPMQVSAEGGEILYAYAQDGREMRGVVGATARFQLSQLPNPMGGEPLRSVTGTTLGTFAASAPDGQLDFELIEAARRSITPDPAWLEKLFALQAQLGGIAAKGTAQRAAIIVAGGAAATQSNIETFREMARPRTSSGGVAGGGDGGSRELYPGEATGDRMQRESIEAVRGVETYHDPVDNRAVQLDHNYDHAWRVNNQEAYILTKDPNFNPGQYGIEATQMGVIR